MLYIIFPLNFLAAKGPLYNIPVNELYKQSLTRQADFVQSHFLYKLLSPEN